MEKNRKKRIERIKSKAAISVALKITETENPTQLFNVLTQRVIDREHYKSESTGIIAEADSEIAEKLISDINSFDLINTSNQSMVESLFSSRTLYRAFNGESSSTFNFSNFPESIRNTLKTKRDVRKNGIYGFDWTIWYYLIPYLGQKPALAFSRGPKPWIQGLEHNVFDRSYWDEIFGIGLYENGYSLFNHQASNTAIAARPEILGKTHLSAEKLAKIVLDIIPDNGSACGYFTYSYADFIYCLTIIRQASKDNKCGTDHSRKLLNMLFDNIYIIAGLKPYGIIELLHDYYVGELNGHVNDNIVLQA